ncbi:LPP20 family lipoprotein [Fusobacterium perfoetens]|uniref:LPP20 family lipoprotein n=1 Tax=Fusobacterium perfoetens TaxID=852 RepID=UPI000487F0C4|nr:LPP20 family lipoprotein [Fusobacterium perfoetens]MCI6151927.1 LPP20 family lipoprotein [Fusobacterium perfoetens]MDY3238267.1 LPP20 family lipoprotein [Fusobacterium perfoetens]
MKKTMFILLATTLIGCSGLQNFSTNPNNLSVICKEKIANNVDMSREIYGIGKAKISSSGQFVVEGKAREAALNQIKAKISAEVEKSFQQQMNLVDNYSKRIYNNSIKELKDYTTNVLVGNVVEKESFVADGYLYIIVTTSLEDIFKQSKFTFIEFTSDLIKRLEAIKSNVTNMEYVAPLETLNVTPIENEKGEDTLKLDEELILK